MAIQRTKEGYDAWYYGGRKTFSTLSAAKKYEKKLKSRGKPRGARKTGNSSARSRQVIARKKSSGSSTSSSGGSTSSISEAKRKQFADQLSQIRETLMGLQQRSKTRSGTPSVGGSSSYQGGSIVDYLGSTGQASDFGSRSKLASQYGIQNYQGTAAQNTQLLNTLRSGSVSSNSGGLPSSAISAGLGTSDVLDKRNQLEEIKTKALSIQDQLNRLQSVSESDPFTLFDEEGNQQQNVNPLTDPDTLLQRYFQGNQDPTQAEQERDRLLGQIGDQTSEYYQNREKGLTDAYREFGVDKKTENLAEIQKEMAERQKKLREDTQRLETGAEFRGVSREFANDQREQIKSQGAFDLANLAIVESAYAGDLDRSRELAQSLVDDQFNAFTGQIETYKAQLAALIPQLNGDQKRRALAIEVALDQRARAVEQAKADQELKYEYATLAAEMNAPLDVTRSILQSRSADEAFMLAAPYMREKQVASTGSTGATRGGTTGTTTGGYDALNDVNVYAGSTPLANMNLETASKKDVEDAFIQSNFSQDLINRMSSALSQEQLKNFLISYQKQASSERQTPFPELSINTYLYAIGKEPTIPLPSYMNLPPGTFVLDAEDQLRPEDVGKYEIRRMGDVLYAIPKTGTSSGGSTSSDRDPY